jgi:hypothetical protein
MAAVPGAQLKIGCSRNAEHEVEKVVMADVLTVVWEALKQY